jgi:hypothetical protein
LCHSAQRTQSQYPEEFETTWKALPKRSGTNSKRDAFKAWSARLKAGATPDDILAGCQRYAAFCEETGKVGTEYVMQGATFFGPSEHYAQQWEPPVQHQRNDDWQAKARRMGLEARDGESWDQFKNRVMQA